MRVSAAGNMPLQGLVKPPAKPVVMIFDETRAARQHGDVSYDLCHDAVFRAWPV